MVPLIEFQRMSMRFPRLLIAAAGMAAVHPFRAGVDPANASAEANEFNNGAPAINAAPPGCLVPRPAHAMTVDVHQHQDSRNGINPHIRMRGTV